MYKNAPLSNILLYAKGTSVAWKTILNSGCSSPFGTMFPWEIFMLDLLVCTFSILARNVLSVGCYNQAHCKKSQWTSLPQKTHTHTCTHANTHTRTHTHTHTMNALDVRVRMTAMPPAGKDQLLLLEIVGFISSFQHKKAPQT